MPTSAGLLLFGGSDILVLLSGSDILAGWLGAGRAGLYGGYSWLSNVPAQKAWIAGHAAVSCAVQAALPLRLVQPPAPNPTGDPSAELLAAEFRTALLTIGDRIAAVEGLIGPVEQARDDRDLVTADKEATNNFLEAAREAVSRGRVARASGAALLVQGGVAGEMLVSNVDLIQSEVDAQVAANAADADALAGIIGGFAGIYGKLITIPKGTKAPSGLPTKVDQAQAVEEEKNLAVERLRQQFAARLRPGVKSTPSASREQLVADLNRDTGAISAMVNAVRAAVPTGQLSQCKVNQDQIAPQPVLQPDTLTFKAATVAT